MKLKLLLFLVFVYHGITAYGQTLSDADKRTIAIKFSSASIDQLHAELIKGNETPTEKVRAFYVWITHNINYDVPESSNPQPDPQRQEPAWVLHNRKAICHGYSRLFLKLCEHSGIPCYQVNGYTKTNDKPNLNGHTWNAVFLDGKWQLIDATWGAGSVNRERRFVREFTETFYLSDGKAFLDSHYPFDPVWQLVTNPVPFKTWKNPGWNEKYNLEEQNFSFTDTLKDIIALDSLNREFKSAERSVRFNPEDERCKLFLGYNLVAFSNYESNKAIDIFNSLYAVKRNKFFGDNRKNPVTKNELMNLLDSLELSFSNAKQFLDRIPRGIKIPMADKNFTQVKNNLELVKKEKTLVANAKE